MDLQPHDHGDLPINYEVWIQLEYVGIYLRDIVGYMWNKDSTHAPKLAMPHKVERLLKWTQPPF